VVEHERGVCRVGTVAGVAVDHLVGGGEHGRLDARVGRDGVDVRDRPEFVDQHRRPGRLDVVATHRPGERYVETASCPSKAGRIAPYSRTSATTVS
jgi:hypothetical protein